jgi:hypothetical protein
MPGRESERKDAKSQGRKENKTRILFCLSLCIASLRLGVLAFSIPVHSMRPYGRPKSGVMIAEKPICLIIDQNTVLNRRSHFQNRFSGYKIAKQGIQHRL